MTTYIIVDIDGFGGKTTNNIYHFIPRECALCILEPNGRQIRKNFYFTGGLPQDFVRNNRRTLNYVSRKIHGFPIDDHKWRNCLSESANVVTLPRNPLHAARSGRQFIQNTVLQHASAHTTPVVAHKGGFEKSWFM